MQQADADADDEQAGQDRQVATADRHHRRQQRQADGEQADTDQQRACAGRSAWRSSAPSSTAASSRPPSAAGRRRAAAPSSRARPAGTGPAPGRCRSSRRTRSAASPSRRRGRGCGTARISSSGWSSAQLPHDERDQRPRRRRRDRPSSARRSSPARGLRGCRGRGTDRDRRQDRADDVEATGLVLAGVADERASVIRNATAANGDRHHEQPRPAERGRSGTTTRTVRGCRPRRRSPTSADGLGPLLDREARGDHRQRDRHDHRRRRHRRSDAGDQQHVDGRRERRRRCWRQNRTSPPSRIGLRPQRSPIAPIGSSSAASAIV